MSFEDVCIVTKYIKYERIEPGKYIFKQGDKAENFYVVMKGTIQLQIPSPFTERLVVPPAPESDVKVNKKLEKRNTLRELILTKRPTLSKVELTELTPMEMMKYKTRAMLNEILQAKDVYRNTTAPWDCIEKF